MLCCSMVLIGTNRIDGRVTASQIRRRISRVVFAALHIRFDIARRHEPRVMPQLLELACPLMRRCARFHPNAARRQIGKEIKNSRATNALADYHRAICIDAVNLKHQLRNIDADRANLAHGRLPSMWLRFDAITLWHFDAAEWVPSTTSKAEILSLSTARPPCCHSDRKADVVSCRRMPKAVANDTGERPVLPHARSGTLRYRDST